MIMNNIDKTNSNSPLGVGGQNIEETNPNSPLGVGGNNKNETNFSSPLGVGRFLLKGLLRDKSRSLLPIIVVTIGVMMTVFLQAYMNGVFSDSLEASAKFISGHVKVNYIGIQRKSVAIA